METKVQSLRIPVDLLDWIDGYATIQSVLKGGKRVTRNGLIVNFLTIMKSIVELQEEQTGFKHKDEIKALIAKAKQQQLGDNQ